MFEYTAACCDWVGLGRKHKRHLFPEAGQPRQSRQCQVRILEAFDSVVMDVSLDQLLLENMESLVVFVEGKEYWMFHHLSSLEFESIGIDD